MIIKLIYITIFFLQLKYIIMYVYSKVQNTKSSFYKMQILEITK
nr:MAG TPA: hypothetical protein [Caudoviricetes sp.]